jgi:hypothetical protein
MSGKQLPPTGLAGNSGQQPGTSAADERRVAAVAMLERWIEEDAALSEEEMAANADVLRTLDEDRPSHRKLFTDLLKDTPK